MSGTSPLEERISIYLFGRSRVGAAIPKVVTVPQVGGQTYFCCLSAGKTPAPPSTPHGRCHKSCTGGQTFFQSSSSKVPAARRRCRVRTPMPLRGACGLPVQAEHRLVGRTVYTAHNKCGGRQDTAAGCGGKVPLPGAHANAPPGGVRATSTGKRRLVSKAIYACGKVRCRVRTPMPLHAQGIGAVCITTYAAHK